MDGVFFIYGYKFYLVDDIRVRIFVIGRFCVLEINMVVLVFV